MTVSESVGEKEASGEQLSVGRLRDTSTQRETAGLVAQPAHAWWRLHFLSVHTFD